MKPGKVRPLAIGIFWRNDEILVFEGHDPSKNQFFYRPLGGAIEFGEYGHQTLAREIWEEIGTHVRNIRYIGLCENIFVYDGEPGHEIVLVYEGELTNRDLYAQDSFAGREDDGSPMKVIWRSFGQFLRQEAVLYPDTLLDMLADRQTGIDASPS